MGIYYKLGTEFWFGKFSRPLYCLLTLAPDNNGFAAYLLWKFAFSINFIEVNVYTV
jgi:hypothetical protein